MVSVFLDEPPTPMPTYPFLVETILLTAGMSFTPSNNCIARVRCVGGGGAGGHIVTQTNLCSIGCSGGSSGGMSEAWMPLVAGTNYTYTIGAGGVSNGTAAGATTFNGPTVVTGSAGIAGTSQTTVAGTTNLHALGANAAPTGGQAGGAGQVSFLDFSVLTLVSVATRCSGGAGGSSLYGTGGARVVLTNGNSSAGMAGHGYGAGGSGACVAYMDDSPARLGGAGTPGCIEIVMMYLG